MTKRVIEKREVYVFDTIVEVDEGVFRPLRAVEDENGSIYVWYETLDTSITTKQVRFCQVADGEKIPDGAVYVDSAFVKIPVGLANAWERRYKEIVTHVYVAQVPEGQRIPKHINK